MDKNKLTATGMTSANVLTAYYVPVWIIEYEKRFQAICYLLLFTSKLYQKPKINFVKKLSYNKIPSFPWFFFFFQVILKITRNYLFLSAKYQL